MAVMERKKRVLIAACLLLIGALAGRSATASSLSGSAAPTLTAEVEKERYVAGEPLFIRIQITNTTAQPISIPQILHPQIDNIIVKIQQADGRWHRYLPLFYTDYFAAARSLSPGESAEAIFPIFFGSLGWTFTKPGDYRLQVSYAGGADAQHAVFDAPQLKVAILPGDGAGQLLMDGSPESLQAGKLLLWRRGDHLKSGISHLEAIAEKYPQSPVADTANFVLGSRLAAPFRDFAAGKVRQPDFARALTYLQKVRTDRLPRYLQIQKQLDQARCLMATGQPGNARKAVEQARRIRGDREGFEPLFDKARRLEPRLFTQYGSEY